MQGVDAIDHLCGNYSYQFKCHKWWVKIFHFVVDLTAINAYVAWICKMEELDLRIMLHLAFKIALGKHLKQS
jgi:hypothetical protein